MTANGGFNGGYRVRHYCRASNSAFNDTSFDPWVDSRTKLQRFHGDPKTVRIKVRRLGPADRPILPKYSHAEHAQRLNCDRERRYMYPEWGGGRRTPAPLPKFQKSQGTQSTQCAPRTHRTQCKQHARSTRSGSVYSHNHAIRAPYAARAMHTMRARNTVHATHAT